MNPVSYLNTLTLCVWKAGTFLERRVEVLSFQASRPGTKNAFDVSPRPERHR